MKKIFIYILLFGYFTSNAQTKKTVLKVYTFPDVDRLHQEKPKPIVAFFYTDWCKICFGMKKNTFKNDKVIHLLNDKFYFVKLNAEQKEDIVFLGKTFVYKPSGNKTGINELANELASINGKISYPTTTILNSNLEIDLQIGNYINSKNMQIILMKFLTLNEN
jgi:thioredoxin-related protein